MKKQLILIIILAIVPALIIHSATNKEMVSDKNITNISELKNYQVSYIKGEVIRILDEDTFRLEDRSGKIRVYSGWKNPGIVSKGEKVTVKGILDRGLTREFYASEIIRENGDRVVLKTDD